MAIGTDHIAFSQFFLEPDSHLLKSQGRWNVIAFRAALRHMVKFKNPYI